MDIDHAHRGISIQRQRILLVPACALIIALVLPQLLVGQDIPSEPDGQAEAVSLLQALTTNWRSLENYEVVVKREIYRIDDEVKTRIGHVRMRLVADHIHHRYLFVGIGYPQGFQAFYLDAAIGEGWRRDSPLNPFSAINPAKLVWKPGAAESNVNVGLKKSGFLDVRIIGGFPYTQEFLDFPIDEYLTKPLNFGPETTTTPLGDDSVEVVTETIWGKVTQLHRRHIPETPETPVPQRRYTFDRGKSVPTRLVFFTSLRDGTERFVRHDESIKWIETNGIVLPSEIHGISRAHRTRVPVHYVVTFDWLAVNNDDKLPPFGVEVMSDIQSLWHFLPEK